MTTLAVTNILKNFKQFSRQFWLQYKALEAVMDPFKFEEIKLHLMKSKRIDPKYLQDVDIELYKLKQLEIDTEWVLKSEEAKQTGNAVHEMIHNLLCTNLSGCQEYGIPTDKYSVEAVENFNLADGLYPEYRMEFKLDDDYTLVGVADLIIKSGNHITIIDYKTSDRIDMKSRYDMAKKKKSTFKYPISNIEDCNYNEYQLQLSLYAWMIKKLDPDFIIDSLQIYHIKDLKLKKIYTVEFLEKDVEKLITWYLKDVKLKTEFNKCKEIMY